MASDRFILDTFKEYSGLKLHFNNKNFIYNNPNQLKYTVDTLLKRNDWKIFKRVAESFNDDAANRKQCMISLFINDKNTYIGDFLKYNATEIHSKRIKILKSLKQYVDKDIEILVNSFQNKPFNEIINSNGDRPPIFKDVKILDETMTILNNIFVFNDDTLNPLWRDKIFIYNKYNNFLYNEELYKYVEEKIKNNFTITNGSNIAVNNTLDSLFN